MKIMIINGPSLNMLGIREPEIYGKETYDDLLKLVNDYCKKNNVEVSCFQDNCEGKIIDYLQKAYFENYDGIVLNAGGYSHTSISIRDAISSINIPVVEVHISDVNNREDFRKVNYLHDVCYASVIGHGLKGYLEAIDILNK